MTELTQEYLKSILHYNPDTGGFIHVYSKTRKDLIGQQAGYLGPLGYVILHIKSKVYKAHRLAFLYMTGNFPSNHIDHINHIRNDNRWCNLREVTQKENNQNAKKNNRNTTGVTGVHWHKRDKVWHAKIKNIYLGYFNNFDDAVKARQEANIKYNYHNNHGINIYPQSDGKFECNYKQFNPTKENADILIAMYKLAKDLV